MPRSGDLLLIGEAASVQFGSGRGFPARVIRVSDWPCDAGWVWLDVYQLTWAGDAVERRNIYVRLGGLRHASTVGRVPSGPPNSRTPTRPAVPAAGREVRRNARPGVPARPGRT